MTEHQIPQKDLMRSSDVLNRISKQYLLKRNRKKIARKSLSDAFTSVSEDLLPEISKESIDSSPTSDISDANSNGERIESVVPGHKFSPDIIASVLETFTQSNVSPTYAITDSAEHNGLSKLHNQKIAPIEEDLDLLYKRDLIDELLSVKACVVFLCFLLWILVVLMVLYFSSGDQTSYVGPLPT